VNVAPALDLRKAPKEIVGLREDAAFLAFLDLQDL
jgi:hypothetical protein